MLRSLTSLAFAFVLFAVPATGQEARQMLNSMRDEAGLSGLRPSPELEKAALGHAMDMSRGGFFSHTGSDGSKLRQRATRAGYRNCSLAENIAKGPGSVQQVMRMWLESPPHRKNMLKRKIGEYGLARAPGNIWVLVLGEAKTDHC